MKVLVFLILFAISATAAAAQNPASAIIRRSLEAIAPERAREGVRSIYAIADCSGPNGTYTTEIDSATGGRLVFRQFRPDVPSYFGLQNGSTFWTRTDAGDLDLADAKAGYVWRFHDYQRIALEIGERFRDYAVVGDEEFAGKRSWKLKAKDELGNEASVFFAISDGLLIGFTIRNPFSSEPEPIRTVFSEWRQVGRLKLPSVATATDKSGDYVLRFREIRINRSNDGLFLVPPRVIAMLDVLELLTREREAHFRRDAALLVSMFADGFVDISNGKVNRPSREASLSRFETYFRNSEFIEWDDVVPPVLKVSDDATLVYAVVNKRVRLRTISSNGEKTEVTDIYSWLATYRKLGGRWQLTAIASGRAPK